MFAPSLPAFGERLKKQLFARGQTRISSAKRNEEGINRRKLLRRHRSLREVVKLRSPVSLANICAMVVFPLVKIRRCIWESWPGFSSLSLLFLVYGFSRRAATTSAVVGGGTYVRDSVTIYFMAHALRGIASSARQPRYVTKTEGGKSERTQRNISIKNSWRISIRFAHTVSTRSLFSIFSIGGSLKINSLSRSRNFFCIIITGKRALAIIKLQLFMQT